MPEYERTTALSARLTVGAAVAVVLLSACGVEGENPSDEAATLREFCAADPEPSEADEARVMDIGPLPGEAPEEVPLPYLEQLDADESYQPPTEEEPAQNVPRPEFSALLCDEEAGTDAASAALSHWFEFYRYGELAGDVSLLDQLHHEECAGCEISFDEIQLLSSDDTWTDGEAMTGLLHMWQFDQDPDAPIGLVETVVPDYNVYEMGVVVDAIEAFGQTAGLEFAFVEEVGHWQMISQRRAAIGDDAFEGGDDDAEGPDAADAEAPELPAGVEENSPEGALAAMDHWLAVLDYTALTGDEEPIGQMLHPDSEGLDVIFAPFLQTHAAGGSVELRGESRFDDAEVYLESVQTDEAALVFGRLYEAGWDVYDSDGEFVSEEEGLQGEETVFAFYYSDEAGHWQLVETGPHTVEEIEAESHELGEPDLTR